MKLFGLGNSSLRTVEQTNLFNVLIESAITREEEKSKFYSHTWEEGGDIG